MLCSSSLGPGGSEPTSGTGVRLGLCHLHLSPDCSQQPPTCPAPAAGVVTSYPPRPLPSAVRHEIVPVTDATVTPGGLGPGAGTAKPGVHVQTTLACTQPGLGPQSVGSQEASARPVSGTVQTAVAHPDLFKAPPWRFWGARGPWRQGRETQPHPQAKSKLNTESRTQ